MKKIFLSLMVLCICSVSFAAQEKPVPDGKMSGQQNQAAEEKATVGTGQSLASGKKSADPKKEFKVRQKKIKKLLKKYRKASNEEKIIIKEELYQVVSQSIDSSIIYVKNRIAAERANLDNWEAKLQADEKNLDQIKARRVEELISGEAERKHKAAQKKWKRQMKEAKKELK